MFNVHVYKQDLKRIKNACKFLFASKLTGDAGRETSESPRRFPSGEASCFSKAGSIRSASIRRVLSVIF